MRYLILFAIAAPLMWAADAPQEPAPATPPAAEAATAPAASPATPDAAVNPTPSSEQWLTGYWEVGYRWVGDVKGSLPTYRSVVDLGSGPKLTGTDFTIYDLKKRVFERIRVRAYDWGDDPQSSFHLFAEKRGAYKLLVDLRHISYFANEPSFADPQLRTSGVALNEQAFDTRRHVGSYNLELFNGRLFQPYMEYSRDSSWGNGITTFRSDNNEYPVPDTLNDKTDLYRGGVHIGGGRYHVTLEYGGTTYRGDQNTYTTTTLAPNPGNNPNPIFGQTLGLQNLLQSYGVRGTSIFHRATVTATPFHWLDVYGHFLYSEPTNNLNYYQANTGNFILLNQLLFYTAEQNLITSSAKMPHTTGSVSAEVRPFSRVRILESLVTDRLHNAGGFNQTDKLFPTGAPVTLTTALTAALVTNYNQNEVTVIADVEKHVTLRGAYRRIWGNGNDIILPEVGLPGVASQNILRNVGIGAVTWRPLAKFSITGEIEAGHSDSTYFRTSLYNYTKARGMAHYQVLSSLRLTLAWNVLSNHNPVFGPKYIFTAQQHSLGVEWNPKGDRFTLNASWEFCNYHSEIPYLEPSFLSPAVSIYRENCHAITGFLTARGPALLKGSPIRLSAGGSAIMTSGSRPTQYYQPQVRLIAPISKRWGFFAEWRYYNLAEAFYQYEGFRVNMLTTGLRYTR
jgi:hypothetical protein